MESHNQVKWRARLCLQCWDGLNRGPSQTDPIPALETKASSSFNLIVRFHLLSTYYVPRNDSGILNLVTTAESEIENVSHSFPTPCNPMDSSPPGSSVHGILQARILKWAAISFSWPRDRTQGSCIADRFFTTWVTREACYHGYMAILFKSSLVGPLKKNCPTKEDLNKIAM